MNPPRFRIVSIMVLVAIVALDFGAIQGITSLGLRTKTLILTGVLPMANLLAIAMLMFRGDRESGRFLRGFLVSGVVALFLVFAA